MAVAAVFHRPRTEEDKIQPRVQAVVIAGEPGFDTIARWLVVVVSSCKHSEAECYQMG